MTEKYYKVTLLNDIVLNASLATEGNMQTLDYIPGSNFLGIVASQLYKEKAYDIFHSGKVSFGDALISKDGALSYAMPFALFKDKGSDILKDDAYVHHYKPDLSNIQAKQHRIGYLNPNKTYIHKVDKKFSLKSAHNRNKRRSEEGKMFGFESIRKGQAFIFSIIFEDDGYIDKVNAALIGKRRIGKSKTAQFGQVLIESIDEPSLFDTITPVKNQLVIYAQSNLCFLNEWGQATFRPTAADFHVDGKINWALSQIRTYSYSPWNGHRNTTSTQRDCIAKGSVIVIENSNTTSLPKQVGEYTAEGLGRVVCNPSFLEADDKGVWKIKLSKFEPENTPADDNGIAINSSLGKLLKQKKDAIDLEQKIGRAIINEMDKNKDNFSRVTRSQWGAIRQYAGQTEKIEELMIYLFGNDDRDNKDKGFLVHGVSAEKIWDKNGSRGKLKTIIKANKGLGTKFVAKFAAQMAKETKK